MNELLTAALSGSVIVAVVEGIREYLTYRRGKRDKSDAHLTERMESMEKMLSVLTESQRYMLYDRIRYLGQAYIEDGAISFDDRRILHNMHMSYHMGLGGNGDLDSLMDEVNRLPLKL